MIRQIIIDVCTHVRILYGGNKNHLTDLHLSSRKRKHLNSHIFLIIYIYIYIQVYGMCVYANSQTSNIRLTNDKVDFILTVSGHGLNTNVA